MDKFDRFDYAILENVWMLDEEYLKLVDHSETFILGAPKLRKLSQYLDVIVWNGRPYRVKLIRVSYPAILNAKDKEEFEIQFRVNRANNLYVALIRPTKFTPPNRLATMSRLV